MSVNDFLGNWISFHDINVCIETFKRYGFAGNKRALNSVTKTKSIAPKGMKSTWDAVPFPSTNMEHIVMLFIITLRSNKVSKTDFDLKAAFNFFLRLQFEDIVRPQLHEYTTYCFAVILDQFDPTGFRKVHANELILKIAGVNEGFYKTASGWLAIAQRFPRTERGIQLTTALAIYVLQHRIDKEVCSDVCDAVRYGD